MVLGTGIISKMSCLAQGDVVRVIGEMICCW